MVFTSFVNACVFTPVSTGTVDFVVSAAVTGWQTPALAGAVDQATYRYRAASTDGTQWEIGTGVYTVSTTTLTRATVSYNSLGTTAKISFTAAPQVTLTAFATDLTPYTQDSYTGSGSAAYTLTNVPVSVNTCIVTVGGIFQPSASFTISGSTLTFVETIPSGVPWTIVCLR